MSAQHTPGPWKVSCDAMDVTAGLAKGGDMKICDIRGWGYLTGKGHGAIGLPVNEAIAIQTANARLIAAAPDLLAALIETLAVATRNEEGEFADRARAAIAKATGGAS